MNRLLTLAMFLSVGVCGFSQNIVKKLDKPLPNLESTVSVQSEAIAQKNVVLNAKSEVTIYLRKTVSDNPFDIKEDFELMGKLSPTNLIREPEFNINGKQLYDFIVTKIPISQIKDVSIVSLQLDKLPKECLSTISFDEDSASESELFDNYVAINKSGQTVMYINVFVNE